MAGRKTGLAAFTGSQDPKTRGQDATPDEIRTKAKGDTVAVTLRLTREQWERVHQLALAEGVSLTRLTTFALSKVFQEKGLPGL
jgi:hypothetical protein